MGFLLMQFLVLMLMLVVLLIINKREDPMMRGERRAGIGRGTRQSEGDIADPLLLYRARQLMRRNLVTDPIGARLHFCVVVVGVVRGRMVVKGRIG